MEDDRIVKTETNELKDNLYTKLQEMKDTYIERKLKRHLSFAFRIASVYSRLKSKSSLTSSSFPPFHSFSHLFSPSLPPFLPHLLMLLFTGHQTRHSLSFLLVLSHIFCHNYFFILKKNHLFIYDINNL